MKKVLVAGATGYLGRHVVKELKKQGFYIKVLARSPEKMKMQGKHLEPAIADDVDEIVEADMTDPKSLQGCCDGMDYVFTSVGITKPSSKLTFMDVDYQGNKNLLKEAERAGIEKFMYIHVFKAEEIEGPATEAKQRFVDHLKSAKVPYVIVRPTGYYSDMAEYLQMAEKGRVYLIGSGNCSINPIHGSDLAAFCVDHFDRENEEVDVGGPEVLTHQEIAETAFRCTGNKVKLTHLPEGFLKRIVHLVKWFNKPYYALGMFFLNVMTMELVAPSHGEVLLESFFKEYLNHKNK
ncbi:SDR family oxidoreductase [Halobacillus sp. BBL2006]|uniref:SDR family oxidoreductase n=1 Tax=Halobacillus sp. BBL2006 TaxID=1543706 RepID=UPI00054197FC|nr:SDR family oxidoreductase [Halobacillus sp. BBL2006]KHE71959.1 hypothetical protein LD39_07030 [Halobacillus sp. BBL2006]